MEKDKFFIIANANIGMLSLKSETLKVTYENNQVYIDKYMKTKIEEDIAAIKEMEHEFDEETIGWFYEDINDYSHFSEETALVLSHYMMVALYSYYEITLKKIMKATKKLDEAEIRSLSYFEKAKIVFKNKFRIKYAEDTNPDFKLLNELRLINNCIKHGGIVDKELHKANANWDIDSEFGDLCEYFIKFQDVPSNYLKYLTNEVANKL